MDLQNFEELEGKIDNLIRQNTSLKEENKNLLEKLVQKDQNIQKLMNNMGKFHKERDLVYSKIVELIDKLEDVSLPDWWKNDYWRRI